MVKKVMFIKKYIYIFSFNLESKPDKVKLACRNLFSYTVKVHLFENNNIVVHFFCIFE